MSWDKKEDTLAVDVRVEKDRVIKRRTILSVMQRVIDPIGFTCPISLCPKLLLSTLLGPEG